MPDLICNVVKCRFNVDWVCTADSVEIHFDETGKAVCHNEVIR